MSPQTLALGMVLAAVQLGTLYAFVRSGLSRVGWETMLLGATHYAATFGLAALVFSGRATDGAVVVILTAGYMAGLALCGAGLVWRVRQLEQRGV